MLHLFGSTDALAQADDNDHFFQVDGVVLQYGDLSLVVDPKTGGRVRSLKRSDRELLYTEEQATEEQATEERATEEHAGEAAGQQTRKQKPPSNNWGSTFWLSPQSLWGWPPIPAHDHEPYEVLAFDESTIALQSRFAEGGKIIKHIAISQQVEGLLAMDYEIQVDKTFPEVAPWEITRVTRDGLVFYPAVKNSIKIAMGVVDYQLGTDNIVWLDVDLNEELVEGKINANGREGWLAWVVGRQLYLKIYEPVAAASVATGEGDIEVYLSGIERYIELEVQGAARQLLSGQRLQWQVSWLVRDLPQDVPVAVGSIPLIDYARQLVRDVRAGKG